MFNTKKKPCLLKNSMLQVVLTLFVLAACGEKKKEEAILKVAKDEFEFEAANLVIENSLRQERADSVRLDSITKDSLSQVKEHGHAH